MSNIKGDTRPQLGKNSYTLIGVAPKTQHWQLLKNGEQIIDLGNDGGITFNQSSINQNYVLEVNYTDGDDRKHKETLGVTPVAGKPNIHLLKWQDDYYEDLNGRPVGYLDKVRLFIHTQNIPTGDTLQVTIWEDQGLDGHGDSSRNMGTYTTKVDKYGKAELYFNNIEVYRKVLNNQDYINEAVHEFYAEVKYMGKVDSIQDSIQLRIWNKMQKMIEVPKFNSPVVVDIPDKQKKPKQKTGVKVTINVFFDGTLNNAKNTEARLKYEKEKKEGRKKEELSEDAKAFKDNDENESSYDNYYSNIAIMKMINNVKPENREVKVYIEGEGTEDHKKDDRMGYGFGSGDTGIPVKVSKAFQKIKAEIDKLKRLKHLKETQFVNEIDLTVFGFSRGAAAARNFIAQSGKLQLEYNLESSKFHIQFIGLYDTVSSYEKEGYFKVLGSAASHDFDNDVQELNLKLEGNVKKVVHLTASDEYRENFSLTNIKSSIEAGVGYELSLPGVHSDIGGGYCEIENEHRKLHLEHGFQNIKDTLIEQGWYKEKQITTRIIREDDYPYTEWHAYRKIPLSYQFIPLAIMIALAEKYGLKFDKRDMKKGIKNDLYVVPEDLEEAKESLIAYAESNDGAVSKTVSVRAEYLHPIRNKYLHRSVSDMLGMSGRYKEGKPYRKHHDG